MKKNNRLVTYSIVCQEKDIYIMGVIFFTSFVHKLLDEPYKVRYI